MNESKMSLFEALVTKAAEEALHIPIKNPTSNFFDQGGDSLGAIVFLERIKKETAVEIPFTMLISDNYREIAGFVSTSRDLKWTLRVRRALSANN